MRIHELEEGLLDNVMARIQNMAGGDGLTGFFRGLAGGSARLDLVIDTIYNQSERMLISGQTNIQQPGVELPMDKIIDAVFTNASKISQTGTGEQVQPISKGGLFKHLKQHQADILKGINAQAQEANLAKQVVGMIDAYQAKQPIEPIPNLNFKRTVRAVALVASVTLLDYEFRSLAGRGDTDSGEPARFDPKDVETFKQLGDQINKEVFTPGSGLHALVRAGENFKINLQNFTTGLVRQALLYIDMPVEELQQKASQPFVDANEIQAALVGHMNFSDPATKELQPKIEEQMKRQLDLFNSFMREYAGLAIKERQLGKPNSKSAHELLFDWAKKAMQLSDYIKPSPAEKQAGKAKAAGEPAGEVPKVSIGGQEIKPTDPIYNKILDLVKTSET